MLVCIIVEMDAANLLAKTALQFGGKMIGW